MSVPPDCAEMAAFRRTAVYRTRQAAPIRAVLRVGQAGASYENAAHEKASNGMEDVQ
jgi:hypothetical protein